MKVRYRIKKEKNMDSREFFYRFAKALYQIDTAYDEFAKRHPVLSTGELWVLFALNDGKVHSQKQISEDWEIPKTTVNFVVKGLEERGYVRLVPILGKRREKAIRLTESGREYADILLSPLYEKEKQIFDTLPHPDDFLAEFEALNSKFKVIGKN